MNINHIEKDGGRPALVVTDTKAGPFTVSHYRVEGETTRSSGSGHAYTDVNVSFTERANGYDPHSFSVRVTGGGEREELADFFEHAAKLLRALP